MFENKFYESQLYETEDPNYLFLLCSFTNFQYVFFYEHCCNNYIKTTKSNQQLVLVSEIFNIKATASKRA